MAEVDDRRIDGHRAPDVRIHRTQVMREAQRSLLSGAVVLLFCASVFFCYWWRMPKLQDASLQEVASHFPPQSVTDLVIIRDVILSYSASNPVYVATGLALLYVIMQTFAVPGTLWLSILSGSVYGPKLGLVLVSVVSTAGSSCCYFMSHLIGRPLVHAFWPEQLETYGREVEKQRSHLLNYIVFLRVTPVLPNTFINVASPIVGVPITPFAIGTLVGCIPNHVFAVNAGDQLSDVTSVSQLYSPRMMALGCISGLMALIPVWLQYRNNRKNKESQKKVQ